MFQQALCYRVDFIACGLDVAPVFLVYFPILGLRREPRVGTMRVREV
jgi:hypothetical protein